MTDRTFFALTCGFVTFVVVVACVAYALHALSGGLWP